MSIGFHDTASVSPRADIGEHVLIDGLSFVGPGAKLGDETRLGAGVIIGDRVHVGERCKISHGAVLTTGTEVADDVFIGARVVTMGVIHILRGVVIAAGATICGGDEGSPLVIDEYAVINPGQVVTEDVPPGTPPVVEETV